MKKLFLYSILAVNSTIAAFGQSVHMQCGTPVVGYHTGLTAAKTTADYSRCIAQAWSQYTNSAYTFVDSQTFVYSGSRSGYPIGHQLKYDNGSDYQNTSSSIQNTGQYSQTFDSHDNILVHAIQLFDASTSSFVNSFQTTYTYDANNNLLTETSQSWDVPTSAWVNVYKYEYTYTSDNILNTRVGQNWTGTAWENDVSDTFGYNSFNSVTMDLINRWNPGTSTWDISGQYSYSYDASGTLTSQDYQNWNGSTWENQMKTTYSNFAVPGFFQTAIIQNWDTSTSTFLNKSNDSFTYNSYNEPVYLFEANWNNSTNSWNTDSFLVGHYYYELYSAGIMKLNSSETVLDVYPNPASGTIYLRIDAGGSKNMAITVQDITGRIVQTIDSKEIKEGVNNIQCSVEQLPAGAYFIHLAGDKANITRKVVIAK